MFLRVLEYLVSLMRTRTRLLVAFMAVYTVLAVATGVAMIVIMEVSLRHSAEARVTRVLEDGGFSLSPVVLERMRTLTGYGLELMQGVAEKPDDWLIVQVGDERLAVNYRTAEHRSVIAAVIAGIGIACVVGMGIFAVMAWWLARQFAGPVEALAHSARVIGAGDWSRAVPAVGSGEMGRLALDLEHMRKRLSDLANQSRQAERLATLGLFTATIAHEVRNPLTAVRLTVQLLRRRHGDDPSIAMIEEELERLDLIVDELLAFSKGITVTLEPTPLRDVADHVLHLLRRQAQHADVALAVEGYAVVQADPARMRQLLLNLALNAIQAQHGGDGQVMIRITADSLAVIDKGPGISTEVLPHMFEPFASDRAQGTGLGLHLAKAIAEAHGATLQYERCDGLSSFIVRGLVPVATSATVRDQT